VCCAAGASCYPHSLLNDIVVVMSQSTGNRTRAIQGEAAVWVGMEKPGDDAFAGAVNALTNLMHFSDSLGVNPAITVESALQIYVLTDGDHPNPPSSDSDAIDRPFKPSSEAVALLQKQLADLS